MQIAPLTTSDQKQDAYASWLEALVRDKAILGGETVFPASRLSVAGVGFRLLEGDSPASVLEDYPYLSEEDLEFAKKFVIENKPQSEYAPTSENFIG